MKCLVVTHLLTVGTEGEMPGAGHNNWAGRVRGGELEGVGRVRASRQWGVAPHRGRTCAWPTAIS